MKNIVKSNITAVILAGGRATRLQGQDKGLVLFNNKSLIAHVTNVIHQDVHSILVSANRNIDLYQEFGEVVSDELENFQGPLAGIAAAMAKTQTEYLLVVPCDGPFINQTLLQRLIKGMSEQGVKLCVATDGEKMHPTFSLIDVSLKDNLDNYLAQGDRKLGLWFKQNNALEVDFSDQEKMFINLNSKEDFNKTN